jgi:hypothetical protein
VVFSPVTCTPSRSIQWQRTCERSCAVLLSAPVGQEPDLGFGVHAVPTSFGSERFYELRHYGVLGSWGAWRRFFGGSPTSGVQLDDLFGTSHTLERSTARSFREDPTTTSSRLWGGSGRTA